MTDTPYIFAGDPTDCPQQTCADVSSKIHKVCHDNGWPPNHKILVCDPATGRCCYCYCG